MTFEKIFQNAVLCQSTGKATEGTEVFVQKKLWWTTFLVKWQPAILFEKGLHHSFFLCHGDNKSVYHTSLKVKFPLISKFLKTHHLNLVSLVFMKEHDIM